jgi:hypothetical protein
VHDRAETWPLSPEGSSGRNDDLAVTTDEVARLLAWLDRDLGRVLVLANNRALAREQVAALGPGPDDLLVQFNRPCFFETFAPRRCHKLYFFTRQAATHFGFTAEGRPCFPLLGESASSRGFVFCGLGMDYLSPFLAELPSDAAAFHLARKRALAPWYAHGRMPSTGFAALLLLLAARERRRRRGGRTAPVQLVGFTGFVPFAWPGHDWWFEQRWLERRGDVERVLEPPATLAYRLRAARWWLRHQRDGLRRRGAHRTRAARKPSGL